MRELAYNVKSLNGEINYIANEKFYGYIKQLGQFSFFPGLEIAKIDLEHLDSDVPLVEYIDSNEEELIYNNNHILIKYPWEKMNQGETIFYLGYPLIEYQRQKQKSLTCHAACVSLNDDGILLMGKEGAGKTSLALSLCSRQNAKLVSNDLCVLDYSNMNSIKAIGGSKFFFLRYESIIRNLSELLFLFRNSYNKSKDTWSNKIMTLPEEIDIKTEKNDVKIKLVFIVHIDNSQTDLYYSNGDSLANNLYLNENFSRYIRSTSTTMIGKNNELMGYIPSLDTLEFYNHRKGFINHLFKGMGVTYVSGNLDNVTSFIVERFKGRCLI